MRAAVALLLAFGGAANAQTGRSCVDVRIGDEQYYDCLNKRLSLATAGPRFSADDAPLGVNSPPVALGQFNQAAVRERLGTSYGKSVIPQRPPPPAYANPLIRR